MSDDMAARLQAMFPGDLVPTDDVPDTHVPMRVRRQLMRGVRYEPPPSPVTAEKFRRVMEALPPATHIYREAPSAPSASAPARQYLLESKDNVTRWLDEARDIESDVKLGQPAEPHQVTRLLLEAIPVIEAHVSRQ